MAFRMSIPPLAAALALALARPAAVASGAQLEYEPRRPEAAFKSGSWRETGLALAYPFPRGP